MVEHEDIQGSSVGGNQFKVGKNILLKGRLEDFLKLERKDLYAVILTYNLAEDIDVKTLISTEKAVLSDNKMKQLEERVVDILMCGGIQSLQPKRKSLREFLSVPKVVRAKKNGEEGYGISRCGYINKAFDSKVYVESKVSPGQENICNHDENEVTV